ncbi:helix-turn-helix domain-containing protein [Nocardia goodfellowii]
MNADKQQQLRAEQLRREVAAAGLSPRPATAQELGALLKHLRTTAEVSKAALGRECLVHDSYIGHAETGRNMPRRRFWAEADIALAADGVLVEAYETWVEPQNRPRPGTRVLASAAKARRERADVRWRAALAAAAIDPHHSYSRGTGTVQTRDRRRTR